MTPLAPSREIVARCTKIASDYTRTRLGLLSSLPGNPVGVEVRNYDDAPAFLARYLPTPGFNCVIGLQDVHASAVPELNAWYSARGISPVFEIIPGLEAPSVTHALVKAGYTQSSFHAVLYGAPQAASAPADGVTTEIVDAATLEEFLDVYAAGWEVREAEGFKNNVRGWLQLPGWTLLLGRLRGAPAGAAILYERDGAAYCADSSAAPVSRGHGVHQALLQRRIALALERGADLVTAQAAYLSTSHRNMERAGLKLLHSKALWRRTG